MSTKFRYIFVFVATVVTACASLALLAQQGGAKPAAGPALGSRR